MKKILFMCIALLAISITSCMPDAYVASQNLSQEADQFRIFRRVVFYNGITDEYILVVEGYCSINVDSTDNQLELTVKTDDGRYMKHFLGLSDNVTYFAEQIDASRVSTSHYRVIFKPTTIIPIVEADLN